MNTFQYLLKVIAIAAATLFSLIILFRLVHRVPGLIVGLSAVSLLLFSIAFYRGGLHAIGIRSRKVAALAMIASIILLILSTAILLNIN